MLEYKMCFCQIAKKTHEMKRGKVGATEMSTVDSIAQLIILYFLSGPHSSIKFHAITVFVFPITISY